MQLICKCGQKFDDKSGWQSSNGLVCGDCYQKSRSHIIMSGFGNQWYCENRVKPLLRTSSDNYLTKEYQIIDSRVTYGPNEPTIINATIRKITDGKIKVGYRSLPESLPKHVQERLIKSLVNPLPLTERHKEILKEATNEILNKDNTKRHRKRHK